jgi:hypothetical protein
MRPVLVKALGIGGTILGLGVAARYAISAPIVLPPAARAGPLADPEQVPDERSRPDSLAHAIAARDPFRLTRAPSVVPFNPEAPSTGYAPPPRPPRPPLALAGIVLGDDPLALIDGLPGVEGSRVMRLGERVGDYVLRAVASDHVVIAGPDTTWTLRLRSQFP